MASLRTAVVPATILTLSALTLLVIAVDGTGEEAASRLIRISAGTSLLLFSLAWSASSLNTLLPDGRWRPVLQARRRTGIAFAISHSFHLAAIIWLVETGMNGDYGELGDLLPGGTIYLFIYLMLLTSNDYSVRWLGARNWQWLHRIGGYLIWVAMASSYLPSMIAGLGWYYWIYGPLTVALLLVRIAAYRRRA